MKKFIRTMAGKSLIFVGCILFLVVAAVSAFGAVWMVNYEYYTRTEQQTFEWIMEDELRYEGYEILRECLNDNGVLPDEANLLYEVYTDEGDLLLRSDITETVKAEPNIYSYRYGTLWNGDRMTDVYYHDEWDATDEIATYYTIQFSFKAGFPENDRYGFLYHFNHIIYGFRYWIFVVLLVSLALSLTCFITLMCVSARRPDTEGLVPGPLNRVPFDVLLAATVLFGVFLIYLGDLLFYEDYAVLFMVIVGGFAYANILLGLSMSIAARVKQKSLVKNTVIYRMFCLIARIFRGIAALLLQIPLVWRTALILGVLAFFEFLVLLIYHWSPETLMLYWLLEKFLLVPAVLYIAVTLRRLQKGGDALANGDLRYYTETQGMFWDFKRHGENLNSIAEGMAIAVEEQMKSERMKTELITNVSHDIKTPLTSIINYATLISNESCENEHITEYSAVLVRQSERLKRLIEDLVEASKASSGNLEVDITACDASVFLSQVGGEYAEKLESSGLTLITKQPETPVQILADGRRMWRIFDNLMNNICKYAQSGTRVYLTLETVGGNAVITFKNTSRDALDISEEELMERFVRGDASRNTEGNGLGLSIAKSLAELQGGSLKLEIDGDLFKAILTFSII